jgi:lipopolysaccharide/colanic/teichoic acid biosynthesis glycosyltransferase
MMRQGRPRSKTFYKARGKVAVDLVLSGITLFLVSPLMVVIALIVWVRLGSPVIFKQQRLGLDAKPFSIVKFRTMTNDRAEDGTLLSDSQRLKPMGRFLRWSSLDELPELWNVLKGDMSLVGPRPLLLRYLPYFTEAERVRFQVKPGITGLAQIGGRNGLPWQSRLSKDIEYTESCSFSMDLQILLMTILQVLQAEGVQTDPMSLMKDLDEERSNTKVT